MPTGRKDKTATSYTGRPDVTNVEQLGATIAELERALSTARDIQRQLHQTAQFRIDPESGSNEPRPESPSLNRIDAAQDLGTLIKRKRKAMGVKQTDLASLAGVSEGTVKAMEAGANVSIENVLSMTKVLGIKLYAD